MGQEELLVSLIGAVKPHLVVREDVFPEDLKAIIFELIKLSEPP